MVLSAELRILQKRKPVKLLFHIFTKVLEACCISIPVIRICFVINITLSQDKDKNTWKRLYLTFFNLFCYSLITNL